MSVFRKRSCQKVVKLHLYCHNFCNVGLKSIKTVFSDSCCYVLSKHMNLP